MLNGSLLPFTGRRASWFRLFPAAATAVIIVLATLAPTVSAQGTTSDPLVARRDASSWLSRTQRAAQRQNYAGTLVFQRGETLQSSRVAHFSDLLGNEYERIEALDGRRREVLRHNEDLHNLDPEARTVVIERRQHVDMFPALLSTSSVDVLDHYEFRRLGTDRVAGLECDIVALEPRDNLRYGYQLCAERATGLLLREQILLDGKVLEQVAFSHLQLGVSPEKQKIVAALKNLSGWAVQQVAVNPVSLAERGWQIGGSMHGFVRLREVRRPMGGALGGKPGEAPMEVLQAVFTDGLANVSIFVEPASERRGRREGMHSRGATNVLVKKFGEHWITVVGEVPSALLRQFASSIEYKSVK